MTKQQKITLSASRDIPFNKLMLSQSNVRHVKAGVSIEELAEDIARRTLLAMSDEEVMEVLAFTMAQTMEAGGPVVEAVPHVSETDLPACWKPEPAFFDLLRDKRAINAMVADIGSTSLAESCASDTAKVQKAIIGNRITGNGCGPHPDWRPAWMVRQVTKRSSGPFRCRTPPARLVEGAGSPPAGGWARIAGLFERGHDIDGAGTQAFDQPDAA